MKLFLGILCTFISLNLYSGIGDTKSENVDFKGDYNRLQVPVFSLKEHIAIKRQLKVNSKIIESINYLRSISSSMVGIKDIILEKNQNASMFTENVSSECYHKDISSDINKALLSYQECEKLFKKLFEEIVFESYNFGNNSENGQFGDFTMVNYKDVNLNNKGQIVLSYRVYTDIDYTQITSSSKITRPFMKYFLDVEMNLENLESNVQYTQTRAYPHSNLNVSNRAQYVLEHDEVRKVMDPQRLFK